MKKLLAMTLALGLFLGGCGGPSAREDAQAFQSAFEKKTAMIIVDYSKETDEILEKYDDKDEELFKILPKHIKKVDMLIEEVDKAKVIKENQHLKDSTIKTLKSLREYFAAIKELEGKDSASDKADEINNTLFVNYIEEQMRLRNEMSLATKGTSTYELTLANYRKIKKGDAYSKVVSMVAMPGQLTNSSESNNRLIGRRVLEHYVWKNGDAYMRIMFENGKVYQMEQKGLK